MMAYAKGHLDGQASADDALRDDLAAVRLSAQNAELQRDGARRRLAEVERERDDARRAIIEAIELPETAMTDPYLLLALEDQVRHLRVIAQSREARVAALVAALGMVQEAWDKSWDCSADPGHRIMNTALAAARGTA